MLICLYNYSMFIVFFLLFFLLRNNTKMALAGSVVFFSILHNAIVHVLHA